MALGCGRGINGTRLSTRRWTRTVTAAAVTGCFLVQGIPAAAQELGASTAPRPAAMVPVAERDGSALKAAIFATVAGNLLDGVTTIHGITQGRAREANPILGQHPARIIAMKSLLIIPQVLAQKRLVDTGHPKMARWLGYAAGGFAASLAIHNVRAGR